MDGLNIHDMWHIAATIIVMIVGIAVIKNDIKWIKQWSKEHADLDTERFNAHSADIRELRRTVMNGGDDR